jgi:hypothetical protein
LDAT